MLTRRLITQDPSLDAAPTDEDTVTVTDRNGTVVDVRSWSPLEGRSGGSLEPLEPVPGIVLNAPIDVVSTLIRATQSRLLRPAGLTDGNDLRLRGKLYVMSCHNAEAIVDPETMIPRRIEATYRTPGRSGSCGKLVDREVQTITNARIVDGVGPNLALLRIGDWPTERVGRVRVPPVPGEGGEAAWRCPLDAEHEPA